MEKTTSMTRGIFCYYYVNLILYIVVLTLNMPLTCIGKAPIIESTESSKAKALRLCRRGETEREVKRMIRYIVKRSGDKVSFDARKIKSAIFKANTRIAAERMSDADLNELTEEVLTALEKLPGTPTAQEIQNVVEEKLLAADYAKTANAYINYRTEHEHLREMDDELVKIFENLTFRRPKRMT